MSLFKIFLPKNRFGRSVAFLAGGTALGQAATVLSSPVLTRIYAPEDFGLYSLFLSFVAVGGVAVSLRYETAIVGCDDAAEAAHLTFLSILLGVLLSPFLAGVLYLTIRLDVAGFGHLPQAYVVWAWLALLVSAVFLSLRYFLVREGKFGMLSQVAVVQGWGRAASQIGLGWFGWSAGGLVLGEILGRGLGVGRLFRESRADLAHIPRLMDWSIARKVLGKNLDFPRFVLPSSLIDILAVSLPVPLIASLYGIEAAGQFALVQRILTLPIILVGGSVADVFHSEIAGLFRQSRSDARALMLKTASRLGGIGLAVAAVLVVAGPLGFVTVFGETWSPAGDLTRLMAPWFAAQLIVSPLSRLVFVADGQRLKLIYDLVALLAVLVALYGGHHLGLGLAGAVGILSALNVLAYGVYFMLLLRLFHQSKGVRSCAE